MPNCVIVRWEVEDFAPGVPDGLGHLSSLLLACRLLVTLRADPEHNLAHIRVVLHAPVGLGHSLQS
ncbi:MAG: hypothetical protein ABEL04_06220 [Salinibacter sp.]|uniref:hypothetical protein n=1 Tax=Salinibacter sp. TaxID=2065818 RepID=UPI0035D45DA6